MNTVHFTEEYDKTYCGKEASSVRYATDLGGAALFLAEYFCAFTVRPCRACVEAARTAHESRRPVTV